MIKPTKIVEGILALSFLLLLVAPHTLEVAGRRGNKPTIERNKAAARPGPRLLLTSFSDYPRQFERHYNHSFGLRERFIRWNNMLSILAFRESPIFQVRMGREGWLFFGGERVLEEYENVIPFSPKELEDITKVLEERRAWLESRGIRFFILVPPIKHNIYPEYLPRHIHKIGKESRLEQLKRHLEAYPGIELIDVHQELLRAKGEERLYHRTDTHWNDYGAFVVYTAFMDRLRCHFPNARKLSLDDYTLTATQSPGGDLAVMLSLQDVLREEWISLVPKFKPTAREGTRAYPDPAKDPMMKMVVTENGDSSLPRVLVFRDSFMNSLIPFFGETFQSAVFVWTYAFLPEIIERERPDIVILECLERCIHTLGQSNPPGVRAELGSGP